MPETTENWFASWFDTPYYHILYKNRDYTEAQLFIDTITQYLNLEPGSRVLDLACGKGRHSIYLNQLGYDVTGVDLSANNIAEASRSANDTLRFERHDMREPFPGKFEAVFNLFTSFGYFDDDNDNLRTLRAIQQNLTESGLAVIDFMNVEAVLPHLVPEETKTIDGIDFHIRKAFDGRYILKHIDFTADNQSYSFTEKVRAFTLADFEAMIEETGSYLLDVFGDYKLRKYHKSESPRLILVFK
ncbi:MULTISPECIES: cyclopropane-fatty-acyl-phospholipid synthase family protein [unclassified Flavobacterium]|uniref:SAM-dependent methyltransferase n=1 Tax=unclassified Flavobacterium TaxID=196869 RepID=UPI001F12BBDD|nr:MULTISPECIES: class I SAM-dependent methyltransferase [unclassified Flavobacterium]UMY65193.1 methyltransferase domain-containing protein [Flavobacterium sp. HJ-32-4]